ncbi:MAG: tRNA lysidine(34) synthetase TilS [Bacilli bacterium]|nr:tRNA lysidine(34) synthetase TilS [Bacilli bacterium]
MNEVINDIKKEIKQNEIVIIATSGGPDSMALINILKNINKYKLICAHVNHKLRKESNAEAKMVKNYCKENNIIFEYHEIDNYKGNTEAHAREKRYIFFESLIKKYKSKYLLTAHHGDDLIETMLMRISRGSNFEGYMGFSKITKRDSYYLYRPLIYVTKDEILNYCEKNKIDYATDITNKDDKYTRNRFRKYILPPLKKENPNIHKSFLKLNATIKEYDEYVNKQVSKIINEVYVEGNIIISKFIKEDNIIQKKILITILKEIYKTDINEIKEIHINNIIKILKDKKPNQSINLPKAYILNKSYDKAHIQKEELNKPYDYIIKDDLILPNSHKIKIIKETNDNSNNILKINSKEIKLPLHIRSRKNGDKIEIKGLKGSKKIKDIFIDEKLPKDQRDIYPLVTDDNGIILWIPGIKKSKFDKSKNENYDIIVKYF